MKIKSVLSFKKNLALSRPYTIAYKTVDSAVNIFVVIELENGIFGRGAGSPMPDEMGEDMEASMQVLNSMEVQSLKGREIDSFQIEIGKLRKRFPRQPAALAAIDIALHDAFCQFRQIPLVAYWGQQIQELPTSITIGIKNAEETLAEANEYIERGFRVLKVKLGASPEEDLERVHRLREKFGTSIQIRVDMNQGYDTRALLQFFEKTRDLQIELIEQPLRKDKVEEMRMLPPQVKSKIAADESLTSLDSALVLSSPPPACGIFNIKLMKCGGLQAAQEIASAALGAGIQLMWGCNDESVISITAALHLAFANAHTSYIDLDGSLDLAEDIVEGGFILDNGIMRIDTKASGLGVWWMG